MKMPALRRSSSGPGHFQGRAMEGTMTEYVAVRADQVPDVENREIEYTGAALRHVAVPLGGLGAGQIALGGDGGLRQWQIVNQINHLGLVPDSFFAIRASCTEPP